MGEIILQRHYGSHVGSTTIILHKFILFIEPQFLHLYNGDRSSS